MGRDRSRYRAVFVADGGQRGDAHFGRLVGRCGFDPLGRRADAGSPYKRRPKHKAKQPCCYQWRERYVKIGLPVVAAGPAEFKPIIDRQLRMYREIIEKAHLKVQ